MRRALVLAASVLACMSLLTGCMPLVGLSLPFSWPPQQDPEYVELATVTGTATAPGEPLRALPPCGVREEGIAPAAIQASDLWPGRYSHTSGMVLTRYTEADGCGEVIEAYPSCEVPFPSIPELTWQHLMGTLRSTVVVSGFVAATDGSGQDLDMGYVMAYSDDLNSSVDWFQGALACGTPRTIGGVEGTWFPDRHEFVAVRPRGGAVLTVSDAWSMQQQEQHLPEAVRLLEEYQAPAQ